MPIILSNPISRGSDASVEIEFVGINYDASRVIVRLEFPSGQRRDFTFEGQSLLALRNAVSNFAGLRLALLQYLQTLDSSLGGNAS